MGIREAGLRRAFFEVYKALSLTMAALSPIFGAGLWLLGQLTRADARLCFLVIPSFSLVFYVLGRVGSRS